MPSCCSNLGHHQKLPSTELSCCKQICGEQDTELIQCIGKRHGPIPACPPSLSHCAVLHRTRKEDP